MKKVCVYILLTLTSVSSTELHQLFKVPVLFKHFAEHQQRDSRVGFVDFLSMHYWGKDINDNDDERDMQLPFKKIDAHPSQVCFIPDIRVFIEKVFTQSIALSYPVYKHVYHSSLALSSPFRPPCV